MPKRFKAPDPDEKAVQYGAEVVRNINAANGDKVKARVSDGEFVVKAVPTARNQALLATTTGFDARLRSSARLADSPETSATDAENGDGEPDPQGDSAANDKEN